MAGFLDKSKPGLGCENTRFVVSVEVREFVTAEFGIFGWSSGGVEFFRITV